MLFEKNLSTNKSEKAPERKICEFKEKFESRNDLGLIFLKGGEHGGLKNDLKKEIINQLKKWFDVTEGEEKKLDLEEIFARWGSGYLKWPALEVAKKNPSLDSDFISEGEKFLYENNKEGFTNWFSEAEKRAGDDPGLLRLEMLLAYYSSGGQNILLKLKEGVTRKDILKELNLTSQELLLDETITPLQEFIKKIVVGETTAMNATTGSLRSLLAEKMKDGRMLTCTKIWEESKDEWTLNQKFPNAQVMASNLLNAIHCAKEGEEMEIELSLLSLKDIEKFTDFINKN